MKNFARVAALAAFSIASVGASSAATLTIGSYGATASASNPGYTNPGFINSALAFAGGTTYDIGTGWRHLVRPRGCGRHDVQLGRPEPG